MQDYNYVFKYIPGETNIVADLLSRRQDLNEGVSAEKQIMLPDSLFHIRKISPCADDNDSLLTQKIFLKDDITLRQQALREIHDSSAGGHLGIANTWDLVKHQYDGPRL